MHWTGKNAQSCSSTAEMSGHLDCDSALLMEANAGTGAGIGAGSRCMSAESSTNNIHMGIEDSPCLVYIYTESGRSFLTAVRLQ